MTYTSPTPFLKRVGIAAKTAFWAATGSTWEGHEINRRSQRSKSLNTSQDADLNLGVREDLIIEARKLCQTVPICERILRQFANYTVGNCEVNWSTSDPEWNETAESGFKAWSASCDIRGIHDLRSMARLGLVSEIRDGDIFINEIVEKGRYFIEAIEGDRVTNARNSTINIDQENIIGGVGIGSRGEPRFYRVCDRVRIAGFESGIYKFREDVPSPRIVHYFDSMRIDSYRGVTSFKTALNHIRDIKESVSAEKTANKMASKLALLVKNASGGTQPGINLTEEINLNGNSVSTKEIEEGVIEYMFNGDSMEAFMSSRPAQGWFDLVLFLIRDISIGLDLPFEFVWNMAGLGGTAIRLVSKQAERTFIAKQENLERRFLNRVAARWVMVEMENGRIPFNAEFYKFRFKRPAHPSVDVGRESAANLAERDAGVMDDDTIWEERGMDGTDGRKKIAANVRETLTHAMALAAEFPKFDAQTILSMLGRANASVSGNFGQQTQKAPQQDAVSQDQGPQPTPKKNKAMALAA